MNYWQECIKEAFEEYEIKVNEQQVKGVIEWVEGAHENCSMATGQEFITNPMNAEVDALKAKIKQLESDHEKQIDGVLKGVARRRNISVSDVGIDDDGNVYYTT